MCSFFFVGNSGLRAAEFVELKMHLITILEFCERIKISRSNFFSMRDSGRIGPEQIRFGTRSIRFRADEVDAWIAAGCPSRSEWIRVYEVDE